MGQATSVAFTTMTFSHTNTKEGSIIRQIAAGFTRYPFQVNGFMEADAEIIRQGSGKEYFVVKTDAIHEEIQHQLYSDPYLVGWMAVTAPVSDIAAVGATPTGILLSLILPHQPEDKWLHRFQEGISDACARYDIHVWGGDTSFDGLCSVSATVIARAKQSLVMLRKGMNPGDGLYATARLGTGNAYAYARFFDPSLDIPYLPLARLKESAIISRYASACTDTSDGLFPALATLWEVNRMGFSLDVPLLQRLSPEALTVHRQALPEWMLLAGPHGEYELLFTVRPEKQQAFQNACWLAGWEPLYLGRVTAGQEVDFISGARHIQCHPALIADLYQEARGDTARYQELLLQQHKSWETKT